MDLTQRKLHKYEWNGIEIPVSMEEMKILKMIADGYNDVNIRRNETKSIVSFLKIDHAETLENYIYYTYFYPQVSLLKETLQLVDKKKEQPQKLNSADKIRFQKYPLKDMLAKRKEIYEYILLHHAERMVTLVDDEKMFHYHYYTLALLSKNNVYGLNTMVTDFIDELLTLFLDRVNFACIIQHASAIIEKNASVLLYADKALHEHQKKIFTIYKQPGSKLTLYMAPTGTGKTLSPIGLCEDYHILFVCAARHVGLSLARAAISVHKKIAFAFGCETADGIRLHNFAAKEFTKNKKTGGIGKIDNSVGDNVQIMISDIKSFLPAMYYMLSFFAPHQLLLYWDEPTITLDSLHHDFHEIIHQNWKQNLIPNIVLSSATLPKMEELTETIADYMFTFSQNEPSVHTICSEDCVKSIPIVNEEGFVVLPHYLTDNCEKLHQMARHCLNHTTLLRYLDLSEIAQFLHYIASTNMNINVKSFNRYFENIQSITMTSIKMYYIQLLLGFNESNWPQIHAHFMSIRKPYIHENVHLHQQHPIKKMASEETQTHFAGQSLKRMNTIGVVESNITTKTNGITKGTSGLYVTTKDAYTITDGPAIFFAEDIEKIAKFYIQQANIPGKMMELIMQNIEFNNGLNQKMDKLESELEFQKEQIEKVATNANSDKGKTNVKKLNRETEVGSSATIGKLTMELNALRGLIKTTHLADIFIPNKKDHLDHWAPFAEKVGPFTSHLEEDTVKTIMGFSNVSTNYKILLMLGIGVFIAHANPSYMELMKQLADEQKLFMIIATTDYIYGTNYQYCHGLLGKDLRLTQEKLIQALGRIGRKHIQQKYTIRIREAAQIYKLFIEAEDTVEEKPEVYNMNRLFTAE